MRRSQRWLFPVALAATFLTPAIVIAAEECITHYSWKCDDDPNSDCEGYFSPMTPEVYTETYPYPHSLWYVIRFSPEVSGPHFLRMSGVVHPFDGDPGGTDEEFQALKKQQAGCTEDGFFQGVVTFDEEGYGTPTDFDLGYTSTTDICIGIESSEADSGQDEMFVSHAPNHYHPVIATIFDDRSCPDSESATDGSKLLGSLNDICVCNPDGYEKLQEGGPPHWRLFYIYKFDDLPEGSAQTLHLKGRRPTNEDGDDFKILYKWSSSGSCTGTFINSGEKIDTTYSVDHSVSLGNSSGTLCVALDDSTGGTLSDVVFVDHVYVVTTP